MDQRSSSWLSHFKYLVVAVIFASLGLALTQPVSPELAADDSFSSLLTLQKKIYDDADNDTLDTDTSLDALLASILLTDTDFSSPAFSALPHPATFSLASFVRPSPRGPPRA